MKKINLSKTFYNIRSEKKMAHIFISYAHENKKDVLKLYHKLKQHGFQLWIDEYNILPGQDWESQIKLAIRTSNCFLALLSNQSVKKRGVVQKELKLALSTLDEFPENQIFLIPVRLDNCEVPTRLASLHWLNLFESGGYEKLISVLSMFKEEDSTTDKDGIPLYPTNICPQTSALMASNILIIRNWHRKTQVLLKLIQRGHSRGLFTVPTRDRDVKETLQHCAKQCLLEETGLELLSSRPASISYSRDGTSRFLQIGIIVDKYKTLKPSRTQALISDHWYEWKWYDLTKLPSRLTKETELVIQHYSSKKEANLTWDDVQPVQPSLFEES